MVGGVRRARREVDEEGLVRSQRLLLRNPGHRLVGHVPHEVIALFGRFLGFDRIGALVYRRVPLVRLPADETVEIFETAAACGPGVERPDRARLPNRHFVAFAELRRRVAVAAAQGLAEAKSARDTLTSRMTPEQIAEAQRLA